METQTATTAAQMHERAEQLHCTLNEVSGIVDLVIDGCKGANYQGALFGALKLLKLAEKDMHTLTTGLSELVREEESA